LGTWSGAPLALSRSLPQPGTGTAVFVQSADGAILGAASFKNASA
jgi:hypothetical protein